MDIWGASSFFINFFFLDPILSKIASAYFFPGKASQTSSLAAAAIPAYTGRRNLIKRSHLEKFEITINSLNKLFVFSTIVFYFLNLFYLYTEYADEFI